MINTMMEESEEPVISSYTLAQLAEIYKVTRPTMYAWLKPFKVEIGKRKGYFFTIDQVRLIVEKLGSPFKIVEPTVSSFIRRKDRKFAKVHNVGKHLRTVGNGYNLGND